MEVGSHFHASAALSQGRSPRYATERMLGGPHSWYGGCGEDKYLLLLAGIELQLLTRAARSPSLYRLLHICSRSVNPSVSLVPSVFCVRLLPEDHT
jgi:hypothetical protein